MIERIRSALERCGISMWRINERVDETTELFFVKKQLDTRRTKDARKYEVTVFRDVEAKDGGKPGRGWTSGPKRARAIFPALRARGAWANSPASSTIGACTGSGRSK